MIILISGYATSGKDTFANFLQKYLPKVKTLHFADPIKECATKYFNWDGVKDERGRRLLQQIGRVGREYNKDIWIHKLAEKIRNEQNDYEYFIVPDWRFKNELNVLRKIFENDRIITVRIHHLLPAEAPASIGWRGSRIVSFSIT